MLTDIPSDGFGGMVCSGQVQALEWDKPGIPVLSLTIYVTVGKFLANQASVCRL